METLTSILQYYLNYSNSNDSSHKPGLVPCDLYTLLIHHLQIEYRDSVSLSNLSKVIYSEGERRYFGPGTFDSNKVYNYGCTFT